MDKKYMDRQETKYTVNYQNKQEKYYDCDQLVVAFKSNCLTNIAGTI